MPRMSKKQKLEWSLFLNDKGFKKSTIKKAKKNAGVVSVKEGMIWYWTLPTVDQDKHNITSHTDPDFKTN